MKKKESKETSPALKNTSDKPRRQVTTKKKAKVEKVSEGSGGARPNSGRKPLGYPVTRTIVRMPTTLYNDIMKLGITNYNAYMNELAEKDVKRRQKLKDK